MKGRYETQIHKHFPSPCFRSFLVFTDWMAGNNTLYKRPHVQDRNFTRLQATYKDNQSRTITFTVKSLESNVSAIQDGFQKGFETHLFPPGSSTEPKRQSNEYPIYFIIFRVFFPVLGAFWLEKNTQIYYIKLVTYRFRVEFEDQVHLFRLHPKGYKCWKYKFVLHIKNWEV